MKRQHNALNSLDWTRGMAVTGAVAIGLFVLYPLALALRAVWRWA